MQAEEHAVTISSTVSEARLASVFDTAADGIVVINERFQVLAFNKACEQIFGYSAAELLGRNVSAIMPADYAVDHDQYVRRYLATGERRIIGVGREVRGRHKDGTEFPVELSVGEAQTPDGCQFIGILRDLRPRKEVEDRLAEAQSQLVNMTRLNAMDEMGAAIAHELNQPLTAILLYLQSVLKKATVLEEMDPAILSVVEKATRETERAGEIIRRMRTMIEKQEPERQSINVASFIESCIDIIAVGANERRELFSCMCEKELPLLSADPLQIRQIMLNLLRNAQEAVAKSDVKKVVVEATLADGFIEICVADTGKGIPSEMEEELFTAFSGTKRKGLGLGLAISRSIAQNHGGDLFRGEQKHGLGARFILRLPTN